MIQWDYNQDERRAALSRQQGFMAEHGYLLTEAVWGAVVAFMLGYVVARLFWS